MLAVASEVPTALGESSTRLAVDAGSIPATSTRRQKCRRLFREGQGPEDPGRKRPGGVGDKDSRTKGGP